MEINHLRVLIVADDPLARAGLASLMADQPDCTVAGQVSGDSNLAESVDVYQPDVVLWDLGWSPAPDLERPIDVKTFALPVVVLLNDPQQASDAWAAGVQGLLLRDTEAAQLLAALRTVTQGLVTLEPTLADTLFPHAQLSPPSLVEALTPRESEVLQLLAEGLPNKTIARRLDISEHTVKFHVNAIMSKLNAQSRTEAVVRATQLGLILF